MLLLNNDEYQVWFGIGLQHSQARLTIARGFMGLRFKSCKGKLTSIEEILTHEASRKDLGFWYSIHELSQEDFNVSFIGLRCYDRYIGSFRGKTFIIERSKLFKSTIAEKMSFAACRIKNKLRWRELTICCCIYT